MLESNSIQSAIEISKFIIEAVKAIFLIRELFIALPSLKGTRAKHPIKGTISSKVIIRLYFNVSLVYYFFTVSGDRLRSMAKTFR